MECGRAVTDQRERERERERKKERDKEREGEREREREKDRERGRERGRERERELLFLFLKGMTGALAPFSYLVYKIVSSSCCNKNRNRLLQC